MEEGPLALSSASLKPILWDGWWEGERRGVVSQPTKVSFHANKNRRITEILYGASYQTDSAGAEPCAAPCKLLLTNRGRVLLDSNPVHKRHGTCLAPEYTSGDNPRDVSLEKIGGSSEALLNKLERRVVDFAGLGVSFDSYYS
uniref:Uncharacterized protein n=1 Tax=Timema shepardi TaxID=629360 RepID=A0A7R9AMP9_TIMSH|nr:unnamed protein product [Timema shepardi]